MDVTALIHHLPVILNQLLWLTIRIHGEEFTGNVVKVLIHIVHQIVQVDKTDLLDAYLDNIFVTPSVADRQNSNGTTVHEEMVNRSIPVRGKTFYFE